MALRSGAAAFRIARPLELHALSDEDLVEAARTGVAHAVDILLDRYTPFARSKARTYFIVGADREDIVQEGMIGLFKAIRDYDTERAMSFRSFADMCVTRQILTAIKAATRRKHAPLNSYISLHTPAEASGAYGVPEVVTLGRVSDPVELIVATDELERIRAFLDEILSDLEAEVLTLYLAGKSYQDIAVQLDRGSKSIDNALQRIKRKLEAFLQASDGFDEPYLQQTGPAASPC